MTGAPTALEVDVVVVGSGAAGLTAAVTAATLGARVVVVEKAQFYGGTSATSGGVMWIPGSPHAAAVGQPDSLADAFRYVRGLTDPNVPDARVRAFVERGAEMLAWLEENGALRTTALPYADYHPDRDGGRLGYRSHESHPLHWRELGPAFERMRPTHPCAMFLGRIAWTVAESGPLLFRLPGWRRAVLRLLASYYLDLPYRLRSSRNRRLTLGNATIGRLRAALERRGGELWLDAPLVELCGDARRVTGVVVSRAGQRCVLRARRGVVLASGGFERNAELRVRHLKNTPEPRWSAAQTANTGDGLAAALAIGAATLNMDSAWWTPVLSLPGEERARMLTFERALPGSIMVDQTGRRYMNEAASYHVSGRRMIEHHSAATPAAPSWILFDARYRRSYPVGPLIPDLPDWLQPKALRAVLVRANTWNEVAHRTGMPPDTLRATISRFNANARAGVDVDFQRGENAYDRYYGDPKVGPNPTLRALEVAPFYALPVYPGDLGTNGGLATDEHARALDANGAPISGLYAAGNVAASVMGHSYPGAGATIGPAMTFGYIAARHALESGT